MCPTLTLHWWNPIRLCEYPTVLWIPSYGLQYYQHKHARWTLIMLKKGFSMNQCKGDSFRHKLFWFVSLDARTFWKQVRFQNLLYMWEIHFTLNHTFVLNKSYNNACLTLCKSKTKHKNFIRMSNADTFLHVN